MNNIYRLSKIELNCNESSGLKPTIYCELIHVKTNEVVISADLEYILIAAASRGYVIEGVTIKKRKAAPFFLRNGDKFDTIVSLDSYS